MELHSFLILGFIFAMSRRASQLVQRTIDMGSVMHVESVFIEDPKKLELLLMNGLLSNFLYWAVCIWAAFTIEYGFIIVSVFAFFAMPLSAAYIFQIVPRMFFPFISLPGYLYFIFILGANFG
jgi:hypothetical protein